MPNNKSFKLRVRDAQKIIFEGEVDRISSFNEVGPFDVYPTHANFISIIKQGLSIYKNNEKIQEIKLEQAVLKVKQDIAKVFLGIEVIPLDESGVQNINKPPPEKK
jgi:F0F1-type ATP synthase epsilon subunit